MEAEFLTMSTNESDRLEVLQRACDRRLKAVEVSRILGITARQSRPALHHPCVHRRCHQPDHGTALCGGRIDLRVFRCDAKLPERARQTGGFLQR